MRGEGERDERRGKCQLKLQFQSKSTFNFNKRSAACATRLLPSANAAITTVFITLFVEWPHYPLHVAHHAWLLSFTLYSYCTHISGHGQSLPLLPATPTIQPPQEIISDTDTQQYVISFTQSSRSSIFYELFIFSSCSTALPLPLSEKQNHLYSECSSFHFKANC